MSADCRFVFTRRERRLLARALRFSASRWGRDAQRGARSDSAAWLDGLPNVRIGLTGAQVLDWASCLGYLHACEESAVTRQEQRELLVKLLRPLGKTRADVDRVLGQARSLLKVGT